MGRPGEYRTYDAFTPTGSGRRFKDVFPPQDVPEHKARYTGKPPYVTDAQQRSKLRRKGAEYGTL
jgi:hypothetical protein